MSGVYRARRQFQPNVTAGLAVFAPADLRSKAMSAAKFTEDNKENEALARSERNFATFVSFRLAASDGMFSIVQRTVRKFKSFAEGEKSDRDFYRQLSPTERLNILLQLT